ncbi:50S ribosomal protein L1 [Candidatus Saccharibacteria bacterium]|nr:50S ribosomal protein L1 [Candidatus Saccharibacteria bacterium]
MAEAKKESKKTAKAKEEKVEEKAKEAKATAEEVKPETKKATTKAGKRSAKAQTEEAEKEAKEARKEEAKEKAEESKPKVVQKPRVKKYTKAQKDARKLIEPDKLYGLKEALEVLPKVSKVKFDPTAELHVALNIDPRQADQMVRSSVSLPAGTGKAVKVAVIASDKEAAEAKKAGADSTDAAQILDEIGKNKFNFDVLIATPDQMAGLGKHAKVLGPKGLMPSPKSGTVTAKPAEAVAEIKKGRAEIKNDPSGIVHIAFGKLSFKPTDMLANAKAAVDGLNKAKPSGVKGTFVRSMYISSSMSPSIKLDPSEALKEARE